MSEAELSHAMLAIVDLLSSLGPTGILATVLYLLLDGRLYPAAPFKAIIAETVAETIERLAENGYLQRPRETE